MTSRRRARRKGKDSRTRTAHSPAFINRKIPFFEFLAETDLQLIEDQSEWLMQEGGLEFQDDPEALPLWRAAGADVDLTREVDGKTAMQLHREKVAGEMKKLSNMGYVQGSSIGDYATEI